MLKPTSLRTQITALLALPLAAVVTATGVNFGHATTTARHHHAVVDRVEVAIAATTAARQLAQEQSLSASSLAGQKRAAEAARDRGTNPDRPVPEDLAFQRSETTQSVQDLAEAIEAVPSAPRDEARPALDGLRRLGAARKAVDRGGASTDQVRGSYADIITPVLQLGPAVEAGAHPSVTSGLSALDALSRGIQEVSFERSLVGNVLTAGRIDDVTYRRLIDTIASQAVWFEQFQQRATPAQVEAFRDVEALSDMGTAENTQQGLLTAGPAGPVVGDIEAWTNSMDRKLDLLEALADDTAAVVVDRVVATDQGATGHRTIALLLVVAALLFAAGLVLLLHRLVNLRLRRLASATSRAAAQSLPEALTIAGADGLEAGQRALAPVPATGTLELDEIVEAFNSVQTKAVGLASRGATLRENVHSVCLNFGRRTQSLVTRQLGHIDDLEARTDDPDTLADLFLLDHLATRLRRNAESLVVMAGADSPRPWARPVSIVNVVRAAAAEATDYSRVDLDHMAAVAISGAAANDVSHLLAELLDNALAFSPPEARVTVAGAHHRGSAYLITVADVGIGMTGRQLADANERIAEQPTVEAEMAGWFGLSVVGRFARRHSIDVRLVPSRPTGVTAKVLLPAKLLSGTAATPPPPAPDAAAGVAAPVLDPPAPAAAPPPPPLPVPHSPAAPPAPPAAAAAAAAAPGVARAVTTGPSLVPRALQTGTAAPAAPRPPAPTLAPVSASATGPGTGPTNGTANGSLTLVGAETSDWPRSGGDSGSHGGDDQPRARAPWLRRRMRRPGGSAELGPAPGPEPASAPAPTPRPDGEVARPSSPGDGDG